MSRYPSMGATDKIPRRKFLKRLTFRTFFIGAGAGIGGWIEAHRVEVTRTSISVVGLPAALEGFTILQMSDFHHSQVVSADYLSKCVELANLEKPNLIALTGDFITGPKVHGKAVTASLTMAILHVERYLQRCIEILTPLRASHGVFVVMGNHDGWFDFDKVEAAIGQTNWRLLRDENEVVNVGVAKLQMVGLRDLYCEKIDLPVAFKGVDPANPTVVLMHNPDSFPEVALRNPSLVLAGHTHGGQVSLPFIGPPIVPSIYGARFAAGLFRLGTAQMYVNRGLGVILPPIRFRVRPEISVMKLTRAV